MADLNLNLSGLAVVIAVVFIVVGLVLALFSFFKRAENLSDEDRLNYRRAALVWIGASALGIFALGAAKMEKRRGGAARQSTLL